MFSVNDKISVRQVQTLLLLEVFGTGVLVLPRTVAASAGQDGWLVVIVATAAAACCAFVLASAGCLFPSEPFVAGMGKVVTRPVAFMIALGLLFRLIVCLAMEMRIFGEIIGLTMLPNTPYAVVCALMLFVAGCCVAKGCETRARVAQILTPLAFVPLLAVFLAGVPEVDFTNLMPALTTPPADVLRGGMRALHAFGGIVFLPLLCPFVTDPRRVRRGSVAAVLAIGALMLFVTAVTIAKFGPADVVRQMWPTLQMMDAITLPGAFIERQDALIMSFWILSVFAVASAGLFFSSVLVQGVFYTVGRIPCIVACGVVVFALSFVPETIPQVYFMLDSILTFGLIYMFAVPLLVVLAARIRKVGERYD